MDKPIGETSTMSAALGGTGRRPRKWLPWAGLGVLVVVIIAAVFVGMISIKVPKGVPQEPPVVYGTVDKIEGKVVVVQKIGRAGGGEGGEQVIGGSGGETKQTEVVVTNETVFYKTKPPLPQEDLSGGRMLLEEARFEDLQSRQLIQVWGEESGGRVTAEVIEVCGAACQPHWWDTQY